MSAECREHGCDLVYGPGMEMICHVCEVEAERDAARIALKRMYDHVHEGCDSEFSNPCNIELGAMHNPCWCRQVRLALEDR
jgi:hypothetical protein